LFLYKQKNSTEININFYVNNKLKEQINSNNVNYLDKSIIKINKCEFKIYAFYNDNKKGIYINYCVDNFLVKEIIVDKDFTPQYMFAITSPFLMKTPILNEQK